MTSVDPEIPEKNPRTNVQIYLADAEWLRAKQREISFRTNTHVTMFDLLHEIVTRFKDDGEGV
jgi:hypothetical protein